MLESIKISSHCLKTLCLYGCKKLVEVEIDNPYLQSFTYFGENTISFSSNALALLKATLFLYPKNINTLCYLKEMEFLGKFNHSKVVNLLTDSDKNVIIPKELRGSLLPPLYNVKHLTLEIRSPYMSRSPSMSLEAVELVDGLLWICPRPETLSIKSRPNRISLKFLYDKLIDREENPCCCQSLSIICWRHCLKEVKIEIFRGVEEERNLKNFFLENAKILEKIDVLA